MAAVLDAETGELAFLMLGGDVEQAVGLCAGLPRPVRAAYEAGPTGYALARELTRRRVECVVAAPSKIPRASGDRVKTDRRDAEHLVRLLLAGRLVGVRILGAEEALRDLVCARDAVRQDLMRCRHRLSNCCCVTAIASTTGRRARTGHRAWLAAVLLPHAAAQATLQDTIGAIDALVHRRDQREREIVALPPGSAWATQVGAAALPARDRHADRPGLCAEIGDFERFARAEQLMSYVGLVPGDAARPLLSEPVDPCPRLVARPQVHPGTA